MEVSRNADLGIPKILEAEDKAQSCSHGFGKGERGGEEKGEVEVKVEVEGEEKEEGKRDIGGESELLFKFEINVVCNSSPNSVCPLNREEGREKVRASPGGGEINSSGSPELENNEKEEYVEEAAMALARQPRNVPPSLSYSGVKERLALLSKADIDVSTKTYESFSFD